MGHYDPGSWKTENPFVSGRNEMSFFTKLVLTVAVLLTGALAYRYQSEILRFLVGLPPAASQRTVPRPRPQPEPTVVAPRVLVPEEPRTEATGYRPDLSMWKYLQQYTLQGRSTDNATEQPSGE